MLDQYGELYHAAWKRSAGPVLRVLEHDCVQDLANHCIHAASPALSSALRRVLAAFHQHKKFRAVDEMLHRVYEPILWRALRVANATVRRQAALLFVDAFPVQDPDAANADFEQVTDNLAGPSVVGGSDGRCTPQALHGQINALNELLHDKSPEVREVRGSRPRSFSTVPVVW